MTTNVAVTITMIVTTNWVATVVTDGKTNQIPVTLPLRLEDPVLRGIPRSMIRDVPSPGSMKAVLFYDHDPEGRPDGWPRQVRDVGAGDPIKPGEVSMTPEELDAAMLLLKPAMDKWNTDQANKPDPAKVEFSENLNLLKRLIEYFMQRLGP